MTIYDYEIKNALIEKAVLDIGDRGFLNGYISLDYGDCCHQAFGNYALYLPKSFAHHEVKSVAGHFIYRIMEIADASTWDRLVGKTIRVKASHDKIHSIGHIIKDNWFTPSEEFKD